MTCWIAAALATRWLYLRCFSCSTGSMVSISPSPAKFSHLAKPLYASTLLVVAVICSLERRVGDQHGSDDERRRWKPARSMTRHLGHQRGHLVEALLETHPRHLERLLGRIALLG